ncbi:MAG: rhomboid family intramembrane serine protease [Chitinophagales bacterium]
MKITYNSPVILTYALIATAVMFIDDFVLGQDFTHAFFSVSPQSNFTNPITFLTLITHAIGHANWPHLVGNFTFILLLGPLIEEKYGSQLLLIMMFITAFITGILNVTLFSTGLLGASGIVFMLILLSSMTNFKSGTIPLTFVLIVTLFIGKEVITSLQADNISQFAHIIGGIFGAVFGFVFARTDEPVDLSHPY